MKNGVNGYKGLNQDTSYDSIPKEFYIDALDMRVTTTSGESQGSITNIKGNVHYFDIPTKLSVTVGTPMIIGSTAIRNTIILLVADDSDSNGWIFTLEYDDIDKSFSSITLKYFNADLNFSKSHPIEAIGRYESDCIQRVYWSDYNEWLRSLNIADPDVLTTPLGQIDIFPDVEYVQPYLTGIGGGGTLPAGEYQAAFRLITANGQESLISPPSNLIHVVDSSESLNQSAKYTGNSTYSNTGKSLRFTIDTSNYQDYDKIELIIVYHETYQGTPDVVSVETLSIGGQSSITFTYTGTEDTITTLTLDEYTIKTTPFKTVKSLVPKDNSLIVANIQGSSVAVEDLLNSGDTFSALTRRYDSTGAEDISLSTDLDKAFNINYNRDAHWDEDWHADEQFKYQADGERLGGEGINISYTFHLEPFTLDGNNPSPGFANIGPNPTPHAYDFHNLFDGSVYNHNTTYPNMASPFHSGLLRGYKRGETYRFGIVFYTKKGETTFVEYIGDIKFPDISEEDSVVNASGYKYFPTCLPHSPADGSTTGFAMGIKFNLDFSTCPSLLDNIESYQIVRVKRGEEDTRRACQGIIKNFAVAPVGTSTANNYDFRINSDESVLHLYPYHCEKSLSGGPRSYNGTFNNLATQISRDNTASGRNTTGTKYEIKGEAVAFYSPELSYNFATVRADSINLNNNPMLLITGAYEEYSKTSVAEVDLVAEGSAEFSEDFRGTFKSVLPVTFNSKENIKQWDSVKLSTMTDTVTYTDDSVITEAIPFSATPFISAGSFYLRNYYALPHWEASAPGPAEALNDPQPDSGSQSVPVLSKGGTAIIGKVGKIDQDPITGNSISPSGYDYFDAADVTSYFQHFGGSNPSGALIVKNTDMTVPSPPSNQQDTIPVVDLVLPKAEVYGGYTQDILEANIFITASPVIDKTKLTPLVYGGDIFLNMYTIQKSMLTIEDAEFFDSNNNDYKRSHSETHIMVTESLINIDLDYGSTIKRGVSYELGGSDYTVLRQETNNTNNNIITYAESSNMYHYSFEFSQENDNLVFFIRPDNINSNCNINDIRAFISNVKTNTEIIDSWTKFGVNNFYDVDDYGPINKILNQRDEVYFFQDTAVGKYSINPRAIVSTEDGIPTELGSGEGFQDHGYISNEHGCIHQRGIQATDTGIYYFDGIHKKIFMIGQGNSPLSEIKGMHSFLNNLEGPMLLRKENKGDNPLIGKGVTITRDMVNDEVLFTFLGTTQSQFLKFNRKTLVYDELMQQFTSFYSATPNVYVENGDILLSSDPENNNKIYQHNKGNWGEFYGNIEESSITMVINHDADINKILRTIEFNSIVRDDSKVIDRTQTITAFRVETEYQDTGKTVFSTGRIKRRFDKWRLKIPRNSLSSKDERLRSTHFKLTLYFDNTYNKELILNRIISYYDIQIF